MATIEQARLVGARDGIEAVQDVFDEQGIDVVRACQAPRHTEWNEQAENAKAAEYALGSELSDEIKEAYYEAYEVAANKRANELIREADSE